MVWAAVDVATDDRSRTSASLLDVMVVLEQRTRQRVRLHQGVRGAVCGLPGRAVVAFEQVPTEVLATHATRNPVDLLPIAVPHIADVEVTGRRVDGEAPWITQSPGSRSRVEHQRRSRTDCRRGSSMAFRPPRPDRRRQCATTCPPGCSGRALRVIHWDCHRCRHPGIPTRCHRGDRRRDGPPS